ncbi:MAG: chromosome segregation protein SMC [Propionibacteriaceae bacterium]|nr:chromosome segregation protein SMC [Propionibacteriaceae bacterium]
MYLKALTLKGFKSFASATHLAFEPGITAIVGPNGSGKSNIVDALAWVMGEQGVKSLRGGQMSDVIFQGTSSRPALGRAEVTLIIDNSDGTLPIDYSEVKVSRTLFRNGGSEYAINGQAVRLLDVQELLSDTGMGREMHVIVGQGQLDAILSGTPEQHRVFIEEAAGVLKHRRRKERAERKLAATQNNLERLTDLISEVRRQLKPLGRQAQVARRAQLIQAELRDAKARLLADDLARAVAEFETELAGEAELNTARAAAEARLEAARAVEVAAEAAIAAAVPALSAAQETWYELSGLRERVAATGSIAAERLRTAEQQQLPLAGRDLAALDADAATALLEQQQLELAVTQDAEALAEAERVHARIAGELVAAEAAYAAARKAAADRRDGLSRLLAQATALQARLDAGSEEAERLAARAEDAMARSAAAKAELDTAAALTLPVSQALAVSQNELAGCRAAVEEHAAVLRESAGKLSEANKVAAALGGRVSVLRQTLRAADQLEGFNHPVGEDLRVERGWERAVAAALGQYADAATGGTRSQGVKALKAAGSGGQPTRLVFGGAVAAPKRGTAPTGATWLADLVKTDSALAGAVSWLLDGYVAVADLDAAAAVIAKHPGVIAVTRQGELLSDWFAVVGSGLDSSLEVAAALQDAQAELDEAERVLHELESAHAVLEAETALTRDAVAAAETAFAAARASYAAHEQRLAILSHNLESAETVLAETAVDIEMVTGSRASDEQRLLQVTRRVAAAKAEGDTGEPDATERDRLVEESRNANRLEMEARLALRSTEERLRLATERAAAFANAARAERVSQAAAAERREQAVQQARVARAVHAGATYLLSLIEATRELAATERRSAEENRSAAETQLGAARAKVHEATVQLDKLVAGAHQGEMLRVERKLRLEGLAERALVEFGLDTETLLAEYGPDQLVPVLLTPEEEAAGAEPKPPLKYVREAQLKRARQAENDLMVLGTVNPLALEEFEALNARHTYLATQVEDIKATRKDLLNIITEVDTKVQEAFAAAFNDVALAFGDIFTQLFPGGKGKLSLSDPADMLNTGVLVTARPAGKKVERLTLLSGGERSLVAVAFLLALFIARPSPFYILDEVEAALDETNLTRLLTVYEELRTRSQLLIITHQKRTMEIADALYGITMKSDGVSKVVSQRLSD